MSPSLIKGSLIILVMSILAYTFLDKIVRFMTYPAPPVKVPSPPPEPFEEVQINYAVNNSVNCWLYENKANSDATVLLMFHGNGENLATMHMGGLLDQFMNLNAHFLAVDYPGYGRSNGKPSEENNIAAANAAVRWMTDRFKENPKIVFGWSLGAAVAIQTKFHNQNKIDGLIAVSAWTSLTNVAAAHYPRFLVNALLKEKYNSSEAAKAIRCPALLMHGERDNIIPFSQGSKVAQAMGTSAKWIPVANVGHNDIFNEEVVWEEIASFISFFVSSER